MKKGENGDSLTTTILNLPEDSLKRKLLFEISYYYLKQDDSINFKYWNSNTFKLSSRLKDSTKIGESYWDLASFWYARNKLDSAYYNYNKAYKFYLAASDEFEASRMMLSMAIIQSKIKDYLGSEVSTIIALKKFLSLNKYNQIYSAYNNLGIINNELGDYNRSIKFHEKALNFENKINDELLKASSYNNLGVVYRNQKRYRLSIEYYKKALEVDSLFFKDTMLFAMLIDNLSYSSLKLGDTTEVLKNLQKSLKVRDSINLQSGVIINKLHLVEYYLFVEDTTLAKKELQEAKLLAEKYKSLGDLQESLLLLTKIDSTKANQYYSKYISLSDSLQNEERLIRNKFARIRFETDEFIAENEVLAQRNFWLITGASCIIILFGLLYLIRVERNRNRQLILKQKQQLANEEIYNLLIDSQNKLDEGKEKEKKRISRELHDGVLSKFFGVRLNLELLNNEINNESIGQRGIYLNELKQLENEIRTVSHQLNDDMFSSESSFKTIVKELLESQKVFGSFHCKLDLDENIVWDEVSSIIKINIYRIIQEALHNITKYSEAKLVELFFIKENTNLKVSVMDNGVGFDTSARSEGIGITNMYSRIMELNGEIEITSTNLGTNIIMYIPLNKNLLDE